jgi:nitrogen fixation NifU-like protein
MMMSNDAKNTPADLGKLEVLSGVKEFPSRIKCATLAWHTLLAALKEKKDSVSTE